MKRSRGGYDGHAIHMASKRKSNASSLSSRCHAPMVFGGGNKAEMSLRSSSG